MPWQETDVSKERVKFVLEWERRWDNGEGDLNFAALCREFGVSRQQGYFWVQRFVGADFRVEAVAQPRSSRPQTSPTRLDVQLEDALVALRKKHPTWGPKKLRAYALDARPDLPIPAASTVGEVLRRRGLTAPVKRRMRATKASTLPFASVTGPNATWCVDFKGSFRTSDGVRCYPLTIIDAHSRLLVRCEGVLEPDGKQVKRIFDSAFVEFGLPGAIRSDNGVPFASVGAGGLTALSVWWLRLGIKVERIAPGKPQQNGRQERFHRTLKAETAKPPAANLVAQQRAFDVFRRVYNEERPHEALGQRTPAALYRASARRYPRPLLRFAQQPWGQSMLVDKNGCIRWENAPIFLSTALAHEDVELRYLEDGKTWDVVYGPLSVGVLIDTSRGVTFKPSKGRMQDTREVSGMSSV